MQDQLFAMWKSKKSFFIWEKYIFCWCIIKYHIFFFKVITMFLCMQFMMIIFTFITSWNLSTNFSHYFVNVSIYLALYSNFRVLDQSRVWSQSLTIQSLKITIESKMISSKMFLRSLNGQLVIHLKPGYETKLRQTHRMRTIPFLKYFSLSL